MSFNLGKFINRNFNQAPGWLAAIFWIALAAFVWWKVFRVG